jgi:hypothetical protein
MRITFAGDIEEIDGFGGAFDSVMARRPGAEQIGQSLNSKFKAFPKENILSGHNKTEISEIRGWPSPALNCLPVLSPPSPPLLSTSSSTHGGIGRLY